ncbi:hypothetical protein BKA62DRAFT_790240, partial [Auriculariales sp. MPI-PUGE-AT-0066]
EKVRCKHRETSKGRNPAGNSEILGSAREDSLIALLQPLNASNSHDEWVARTAWLDFWSSSDLTPSSTRPEDLLLETVTRTREWPADDPDAALSTSSRRRVHSAPSAMQSLLVDVRRANQTQEPELRDMIGHQFEFIGDQYGSRFIEQKSQVATTEEGQVTFHHLSSSFVRSAETTTLLASETSFVANAQTESAILAVNQADIMTLNDTGKPDYSQVHKRTRVRGRRTNRAEKKRGTQPGTKVPLGSEHHKPGFTAINLKQLLLNALKESVDAAEVTVGPLRGSLSGLQQTIHTTSKHLATLECSVTLADDQLNRALYSLQHEHAQATVTWDVMLEASRIFSAAARNGNSSVSSHAEMSRVVVQVLHDRATNARRARDNAADALLSSKMAAADIEERVERQEVVATIARQQLEHVRREFEEGGNPMIPFDVLERVHAQTRKDGYDHEDSF